MKPPYKFETWQDLDDMFNTIVADIEKKVR